LIKNAVDILPMAFVSFFIKEHIGKLFFKYVSLPELLKNTCNDKV